LKSLLSASGGFLSLSGIIIPHDRKKVNTFFIRKITKSG
jgi:hypothetical protein